VEGNLDARSATSFKANNLTKVERIYLSKSRIKKQDIFIPEETKLKIKYYE